MKTMFPEYIPGHLLVRGVLSSIIGVDVQECATDDDYVITPITMRGFANTNLRIPVQSAKGVALNILYQTDPNLFWRVIRQAIPMGSVVYYKNKTTGITDITSDGVYVWGYVLIPWPEFLNHIHNVTTYANLARIIDWSELLEDHWVIIYKTEDPYETCVTFNNGQAAINVREKMWPNEWGPSRRRNATKMAKAVVDKIGKGQWSYICRSMPNNGRMIEMYRNESPGKGELFTINLP